MKRLFLLISIFILCLSISMFADKLIDYNKPAIRNTRLGIVYTNFDIAADNAISGDTFELGIYSDTHGWQPLINLNIFDNYFNDKIIENIFFPNTYRLIKQIIKDNSKNLFIEINVFYDNKGNDYLYDYKVVKK